MLRLKSEVRVFLATEPVDGRKAINGLSAFVVNAFDAKFTDGSVFVFYNRARDRVKCLFWDRNGFVLYHKRLEKGRFKIEPGGPFEITQRQLDWLLAGLDFSLMSAFSELDFEHLF
jgi:transposase